MHITTVPSTFQFFAWTSCWSCWLVANTKWRLLRLQMSALRNPVGMFSSEISNARSVGSSGRSCCHSRFAALAMFSGFGREGHGFWSICSSSITSFTIAEAGRNKFSRATCHNKNNTEINSVFETYNFRLAFFKHYTEELFLQYRHASSITYIITVPVSRETGSGLMPGHQIHQGGCGYAVPERRHRLAGSLRLHTGGLFGARYTASRWFRWAVFFLEQDRLREARLHYNTVRFMWVIQQIEV